ncbi:hypothetical protein D3867_22205 (plasmid) [Azospirillum argentinense]|uniref:Uncharacterized protein n=1 Tax=Azospirillum brasilense TaxID=192 RepID=A0A4D8QF13_AZOBR|nr:hypothetical protein D3867_22205 [Azospirillum argentinense]
MFSAGPSVGRSKGAARISQGGNGGDALGRLESGRSTGQEGLDHRPSFAVLGMKRLECSAHQLVIGRLVHGQAKIGPTQGLIIGGPAGLGKQVGMAG